MAAPVYDDELEKLEREYSQSAVPSEQEEANIRTARGALQQSQGRAARSYQGVGGTHVAAPTTEDEKTSSGKQDGSSTEESRNGAVGAAGLRNKEEDGGGFFRNDDGGKKKRGGLKSLASNFKSKKRILILIATTISALATGIAGLFGMISPFKALSIPQFLEDKMFSSMNNATSKMGEQLFTSYVKRYVLPSLIPGTNCSSTKTSRHCTPKIQSNTIVGALFERWRNAKHVALENKLALNHGIELYSDGGRYFMRSPALGNAVSLDAVANGTVSNMFELPELSKNEVRAEMRKAFQDESFFKKLMMRHRVGNLLKKKYGIVRCQFACDFKNKFKIGNAKKRAFYAKLIERVETPRLTMISTVIQCMMQECGDHLTPDNEDPNSPGANEPKDDFDRTTRATLAQFASKYSSAKLEDLVKNLDEIKKDGFGMWAFKKSVEKVLGKIVGEDVAGIIAQRAAAAATPLGWILLAIKTLYFLQTAGAKIHKYAYMVNSTTMVATFYMFRTFADEVRSHHVDAMIMGSMTDALSGNVDGRATNPVEASPLYDYYFGTATSPTAAFMQSLLPPKAYAQGTGGTSTTATEKCNDGKTVQESQSEEGGVTDYVCNELNLLEGTDLNKVLDGSAAFINSIPILREVIDVAGGAIAAVGGFINDLVGAVVGFAEDVVLGILETFVPGIGALIDKVKAQLGELAMNLLMWLSQFVVPQLLPDGFGSDRLFDVMTGGADAAGNEAAHNQIGGKLLTTQERAMINADQTERENEDFAILPLKDRLFATDNERSFISQVALNTPSNITTAAQSNVASLLANPFSAIADSFASLLTWKKVSAQQPQGSPFQIAQYGIPIDNPVFKEDPVDFWDNNCEDGKIEKAWSLAKDADDDDIEAAGLNPDEDRALVEEYGYTLDPKAGLVVNETVNPCKLIRESSQYDKIPPQPKSGGLGAGYSGQPMPLGDIPGWTQTFADDFNTPQPLGSWATQDSEALVRTADTMGTWNTYPDGWPSTFSGRGYEPSTVIEVNNTNLIMHLHDGLGANPSPVMANGDKYQTYGRYGVRMKTSGPIDGMKFAFLLWPENEGAWECAESDWPEGGLAGNHMDYFHHNCGGQDSGGTDVNLTEWHNYFQDWAPGKREYFFDDQSVGVSTNNVYADRERWQLQTEPEGGGGGSGDVFIDWVVAYAYAGQ